jgi:hypothetical protein
MAGLLLAAAMLAAPPILSKVITVTVSTSEKIVGSIVVGTAVPSDSQLFSDEQEVLASINTANDDDSFLCQLGMDTILTRQK